MKVSDLKPELLWKCFDEITKVPRPTHHLDKMKKFLVDWATEHNIPVKTDAVGNVVMTAPATPGHENAPVVVLQGHQDMVAEKNQDVQHDFLNDPIQTIVDGDWVRANGTTLGADNGMAVAAGMAVLLDKDLVHGPLEVLFTVDEEQGLIGANGLEPGMISGKILLNLDSEEHGTIVIGCAGSIATLCHYPFTTQAAPADYVYFNAAIRGLKGGHSGMEIHLGRANANQQLARFLWESEKQFGLVLSDFAGGGLPNAIPREATALFGVPAANAEALKKYAAEFSETIHNEFKLAENTDFTFTVEEVAAPETVINEPEAYALVATLFGTPNGVQAMSLAVPGLVETSTNLASVRKVAADELLITTHQRSSVDSRRDEISDRVRALYENIGCRVETDDPSVGWAPNPESKVLKVAEESFKSLFGTEPKVEALHAGLECGIIMDKVPGMEAISFGPTLKDIHSPGEKANIPSVQQFWYFLTDILRRLA
ncbi:MAG: aminoacyl-histidine dipeptidase [Prevotella sp.]|nr:aminoacyl-histidine dipeptidase [Prevotella sp.]MCM1075331.1 aminoacyl-histidine dipeptidase [Ruminococcus sp.]